MGSVDIFAVLRRRWIVIAVTFQAALLLAFLTARFVLPAPSGPGPYSATALVLNTGGGASTGQGQGGGGLTNFTTLAYLMKLGEIPARVAAAIDYQGSPEELASRVQATPNQRTGLLHITSTAPSRAQATAIANGFATELIAWVRDRRQQSAVQERLALEKRLDVIDAEIASLDRQIDSGASLDRDVLMARRDARIRQYGVLFEQSQQLAGAGSGPAGLDVIENAQVGLAQPDSGPLRIPEGALGRMVLGGFLGLLAGIGLALVVERFDSRIHDRYEAESRFGLPVLAEIPELPRRLIRTKAIARSEPRSQFADALRFLATTIQRGPIAPAVAGKAHPEWSEGTQGPQAILVTSAAPSEGKSTIVANLGATFAELGFRVIVMSCDFRQPRVHQLLGVSNETGLTDAIVSSNNGQPVLHGHLRHTDLEGANLVVVPSGQAPERPGELLNSHKMHQAIQEARTQADIVLIDTPPVLATSDAASLFSEVDTVLLVARSHRTRAAQAERTSEMLNRLGVPVVGVALNCTNPVALSRRYDRHYLSQPPRRGFPRLARHSKDA